MMYLPLFVCRWLVGLVLELADHLHRLYKPSVLYDSKC